MPWTDYPWADTPAGGTPILASVLKSEFTRVASGMPFENVLWHGAVPGFVGDQTAAIQSAIEAVAATAGTAGGTVFIPRGNYRMAGSLELHDNVSLVGEGRTASQLTWPTSLGPDTWALTPDLTTGFARHGRIAGLRFQGPGSWSFQFGTPLSDMNGVWIGNRQVIEDCGITGFHKGLGVISDHLQVRDMSIGANTYSIAWLPGAGGGDHHYTSCDLTGATIATLYIQDQTGILGSTFTGVHMGIAPYGILSEPGKAGSGFMGGVTFVDSHIEFFGTAAIWGSNDYDLIYSCRWITCASSHVPGYELPATTYEFWIRAGDIKNCVFDMNSFAPPQEPGTAYVSTTGTAAPHLRNRFEMMPQHVLRSGTANFLHRTNAGNPAFSSFVEEDGGSGMFFRAEAAVTKGQLVKLVSEQLCRIYDDDTLADAPLGVALQDAAAGTIVAVATQGFHRDLLVSDGAISNGRLLKPAATNGRVVQATSWSDGPIVGVVIGNPATGVPFPAHLRLGAWG